MAVVRVLLAVVVAVGVATASALTVSSPAAAMGLARCEWTPDLLLLPANAVQGRVTGGDGDWLVGVAGSDLVNDPDQGVLWRRGRLYALGLAFGLDTYLQAVSPDGVAVGRVTGADGYRHAVRYRAGHYEYLPETGGSSDALDINPRGDVVGYDGPGRLVVWSGDGGAVRVLSMPPGEAPYRSPAIDDDGTVVAWAGRIDERGRFVQRGYVWTADGERVALAPRDVGDDVDVRDVRNGRVVGASGPVDQSTAVVWAEGGSRATTLAGGVVGVAVNRVGQVVGVGPGGTNLIWSAVLAAQPLPTPGDQLPGEVTAVNDDDAGGYSYPPDAKDSVPVRWRCR